MGVTITAEGVTVAWELAGRPEKISMVANLVKTCPDGELKTLLSQLPVELLNQLAESKTKRERRVLVALADLVVTTDLDQTDEGLGSIVGKNSNTPAEGLQMLAQSPVEQWRYSVARNSKTPADILVVLSEDATHKIRGAVGRHKNTPSDILTVLANDKYAAARGPALANPHLPCEVLISLLPHKGTANTFDALAYHSTDPEVLEIVAQNCPDDPWRKYNVACNEHTPENIRMKIYHELGDAPERPCTQQWHLHRWLHLKLFGEELQDDVAV